MKFKLFALAVGVVSLCACTTGVISPTAPTSLAPPALAATASFALSDGFEAAFYRAFLQNGHESPNRLEPIRLLAGPVRIYVRTEDDAGRAIDAVTLDSTERVLKDSAWIWSGETFNVAEITRGSGTREKASGWLTIKWTVNPAAVCGRSTVGVDGGFIELNASGACSCGLATRIYPRLVRHEMGHAMGYYHTDDAHDVMSSAPVAREACDALPSERERRHAKIAYRHPR
ncbi:MAG TPA: hypothetical protein VEA16_12920 [Vicinamibacterales bacterium]|nr:hypothetical protein [Vicinamibacterales bacterium]